MNMLLKLKNWQLFIISFLLPTIIVIVKLTTVDLDMYESGEFNDFLMPVSFIYYVILFAWNYRVIKTFNRHEKALTQKQLKLLDFLLLVLVVYVLYNVFHEYLGISKFGIVRILFWIFTLTSVFAFFYTIYCTAKTLKYLQFKNQLRVPDIIVEMFLILYFPIGVWWLQRKVNKYYREFNGNK